MLRNVAIVEMVDEFGPGDWDRLFRLINSVMPDGAHYAVRDVALTGLYGMKLFLGYRWTKLRTGTSGTVGAARTTTRCSRRR